VSDVERPHGSATYAPLVIEHYRHPRNYGALDAPTVSREGVNPLCGDRVRIDLAVGPDGVAAARFRGDACAVTIAAASLLTEHVAGQTLAAIAALGDGDVFALLGVDLPAGRRRCATLPLEVLQAAVRAVDR
jgi:nitrogen fixation NifU-like protein